jgi:hypothetical protein
MAYWRFAVFLRTPEWHRARAQLLSWLDDPTTRATSRSGTRSTTGASEKPRALSTAGGDAPIDDCTLLARLLLDGDQPQALCEPDGRARLSPADVGSFGDASHR